MVGAPFSHGKMPSARRREAGLSLVEVLVTLSITALASVMIVATARPADTLKSEHDRLVSVLERLDARSKVSGEPAALVIERTGYAPAFWNGSDWQISERERRSMPVKIILRTDAAALNGPQVQFDPLLPSPPPALFVSEGSRELRVQFPKGAQR